MLVTLRFVDTSPDRNPLSDVRAAIYRNDELLVVAVSGEDGLAVADIEAGEYKVIVSCPTRMGYSVRNPYGFVIEEPSTFEIPIELFTRPVATKAGYCRCSGYLESVTGTPMRTDIVFTPVSVAALRHGALVLGGPVTVTSNDLGYCEVDLLRGGLYTARFSGSLPLSWWVRIPDSDSAPLPEVLMPIVSRVEFDRGNVKISIGEEVVIGVTVHYTSGLAVSGDVLGADWPVEFSTSADGVVSITRRGDGTIAVLGSAAGEASVSAVASAVDDPILSIPRPDAIQGVLVVTVE